MKPDRVRVCFVCLGNICRSPTAEGVFQRLVHEAGLSAQVVIDSAGTAGYHQGSPADARSRRHAEQRGYKLESRARQFTAADFATFDYVLAMDAQNLSDLEALGARGTSQLLLFRSFDETAPAAASVPDPYYTGEAGFEEVLDQCERAARGLLEVVRRRLKASDAQGHA